MAQTGVRFVGSIQVEVLNYAEARDFLFGLPSWTDHGAYHPGLGTIRALLAELDDPHLRYPVVHVAGTNGKGSVSAMIAASLTAAGNRVGLHTSPHLFSFTERMRVDGAAAPDAWVARATTSLEAVIKQTGATFFEASTALAFAYFGDLDVDVAVVEVGMGGRLDATNIVEPAVTVITNVGFDHTEYLGETLGAIAAEKAGIIKESVPVVSGCKDTAVREVIRQKARLMDARLVETGELDVEKALDGLELDLPGLHQRKNAVVAVEALRELAGRSKLQADIRSGLADTRRLTGLRGRCDILTTNPTIVADAAHNPEGLAAALEFMAGLCGGGRFSVLFGVSKGKDVAGMMDVLRGYDVDVYLAEATHPRLVEAGEIAALAGEKGLRIVEIGNPMEIVKRFSETSGSDDSLLATGSHFVLAMMPSELFDQALAK